MKVDEVVKGDEVVKLDEIKKVGQPLVNDFLLDFYVSCQEELTRFGSLLDGSVDTGEDLLADCHEKLRRKYAISSRVDYLKLMKTSMRNQFNDQFRRNIWIEENPHPERISPTASMDLEEQVCRREEHALVHLALSRMSEKDQMLLREEIKPPKNEGWVKHQALKRLERKVIEVIAEQQIRHLQEQETLKKEGQE